MTDKQYIQLASEQHRKKLLAFILAFLFFLFVGSFLVALAIILIWKFPDEYIKYYSHDVLVIFRIILSILLGLLPISTSTTYFVLIIVEIVFLCRRKYLIQKGKEIVAKNEKKFLKTKIKDDANKEKRLEKEKYKTADIEFTNILRSKISYYSVLQIWINIDTRLIQFYVPVIEKEQDFLYRLYYGNVKLQKTKVLMLDDIKDITLTDITIDVETSKGIAPGIYDEDNSIGVLTGTKKKRYHHYHKVDISFNDSNCPLVTVFYHNDKANAEILVNTLEALKKKA